MKLAECIVDAELPAGVFSMVTGPGSVVGDEVAASAGHARRRLHRLGRDRTARSPHAQRARRRCSSSAATARWSSSTTPTSRRRREASLAASFLCAGQSCTAGERFLVHEAVHDEFVEQPCGRRSIAPIRLGDPLAEETTMGPLNNEPTAQKMDQHVADALERGAAARHGRRAARPGSRPTSTGSRPCSPR